MSRTIEEIVTGCFDSLQLGQRFKPYAQEAEDAGFPGLARIFRAVVASETAREAMLRQGVLSHANALDDYFVCPACGLVFHAGAPEHCPVDETPQSEFIRIE